MHEVGARPPRARMNARDRVDLVGDRGEDRDARRRAARAAARATTPFVSATSPRRELVADREDCRPSASAASIAAWQRSASCSERRAFECRLTPDRALDSLDEAEAFLRDRGLLTRTADSALPSLYEACHEEAYKPGSGGFGEWPRTKWPWFGELAERGLPRRRGPSREAHTSSPEHVAALLDPILREELARMHSEAEGDWAQTA